MNTEELIKNLSQDAQARPVFCPAVAVLISTIVALTLVLILSLVWLTPRADLLASLTADHHVFFLKLAFALGIVFSALPIIRDLSVPGRRLGSWSLLALVPFVVIGTLALNSSTSVHGASHHADLASWVECLWQIPALSIPALAILLIAVRSLAPTNLRLIGAYIGLAAGGIGAVGYAFHCDDDSMVFIATFYSIAIFEMAVVGALLGPRFLRWTGAR